jgi:Cytochrome P450
MAFIGVFSNSRSLAGSDTTATAIRATMLCLMQNKKAYKALVSEVDEAVRTGKIPSGPEEVISESQGRQLPYLQAVIKEVCTPKLGSRLRLTMVGSEMESTDRRTSCKTGQSRLDHKREPQI